MRGHINNNSSVRRNNVNPNSGVWSGWFPQGEHQGRPPALMQGAPRVNNFSAASTTPQAYGGQMPLEGVGMFGRLDKGVKQLGAQVRQAGLTGFAVTGDVLPGPKSDHMGGGGPGFPDGSGAGRPANTSRAQARGLEDGADAPTRIRGEIQGAAQMAALDAGPRVHKMAPRKEMPPVGNTQETKVMRALGPGPSSQFGNNPAGDIRGDLAEAAQLMGGKQVSMGGRGPATSRPVTPAQRSDAQKARQRKAGGNMGNLPWNQ